MPRRREPPRVLRPYRDKRYPEGTDGAWYCLTVTRGDQGQSTRVRTTAATEDEAKKLKAALEAELEAPEDLTVERAIEKYLEHVTARGCKSSTVETYKRFLFDFFPASFRVRLLTDLTQARAQVLYDALVNRKVRRGGRGKEEIDRAAATHRNALYRAKGLAKWAAHPRRGYLPAGVFQYVDPVGKVNTGKKKLRIDEARKFDASATLWASLPRDSRSGWEQVRKQAGILALLIRALGNRASELPARVVRDVDDGGAVVWIDEAKNRASEGAIPIPAHLRAYLLELCEGRPAEYPLFDRIRDRGRVWYWVQRLCDEAEVPRVSAHSFRGLRADLAVLDGGSERDAAAAVRDKSASVVRKHYLSTDVVEQARTERALRVVQGGRR